MKALTLFAVLLLASCASNPTDETSGEDSKTQQQTQVENKVVEKIAKNLTTDQGIINGTSFELIQKEGIAYLKTTDSTVSVSGQLKLTPPCYFLRKNDSILSYSYDDVNVLKTIIIVGNIANHSEKSAFGVQSGDVCGKKIQGLLFKGEEIKFSEKTLDGALTCKDSGVDEKDFWAFAHD